MAYPTKLVLSGLVALAILALVGCAPGRRRLRVLACVGAGLLSAASATGAELEVRIGSTENFNILASTPELLKWSKERCEYWRREIALEWLGEELKPGEGYSHWHIEVCTDRNSGETWPYDPEKDRKTLVWATAPAEVLDSTIAHEMAHVVFAARFQLPRWADEGIASRYDNHSRAQLRRDLLNRYDADKWLKVREVVEPQQWKRDESITQTRQFQEYTLSESLVEYLLTLGSKQQLIAFASDKGENALLRHYKIRDADDLETRWRLWISPSLARN